MYYLGTYEKSLDKDIDKDKYIVFMRKPGNVAKKAQKWVEKDLGFKDMEEKRCGYDNISENGRKFEVRCFGKDIMYLIPSGDIGKGRDYNKLNFQKKVESIFGFIIVDIMLFPIVKYYFLPSSEVI
jgi:hypothetical protein